MHSFSRVACSIRMKEPEKRQANVIDVTNNVRADGCLVSAQGRCLDMSNRAGGVEVGLQTKCYHVVSRGQHGFFRAS
jgi:hypothetical protein